MKPQPYRDVLLIIVLCAIGMLLGKFQNSERKAGRTDFASSTIQAIVRPPSNAFSASADKIGSFFYGIFNASSLTQENRRLRAVEQAAKLYDSQVDFYRKENTRLRAELKLGAAPGQVRIPAVINGFFPYENRVTLNKGTAQGVKAGLPIVSAAGLVGVVQNADKNSSQALLISSRALQVGARIDRTPAVTGILRGDSPGSMILDGIDYSATLQVGDLVMTSGYSEHIPRGIPIGRIIKIENDEDNGSKRCIVFPNVQIGDVHEVFVLR